MTGKRPDAETGKDYPRVTRLGVLHGPLEVVDVRGIIDRRTARGGRSAR